MQAVSRSDSNCPSSQVWFQQHLPELLSRCHAFFHFLPPVEQEEAEQETLASAVQYVTRAAGRGKLDRLTPYTLILFFGRLCKAGRRMAGSKTLDALSETAQRRGHHKVHSLAEVVPVRTDLGKRVAPLCRVLDDPREPSPFENARRSLDYPEILDMERVNSKGRRVFQFLCETHGQGSHPQLARKLGVSPGRVSQLKGELAAALSRHGYSAPPTRAARRATTSAA